jgi:hypothetical protein
MLVGLLGEAGSGKDAAGRFLVQDHGFYSMALADPLKVFCSWMFDWGRQRLFDDSQHRGDADERHAFTRCPSCMYTHIEMEIDEESPQTLCPHCSSLRAPEEWTGHLTPRWAMGEDHDTPARRVLVSDVRMRREVETIRQHGGKVFRVRRDTSGDSLPGGIPAHDTELEQRGVPDDALDGVIENNGTLKELRHGIGAAVMGE